MNKYLRLSLFALVAAQIASASSQADLPKGKAPFDPSKTLKDYAGATIIGTKSSATGRSDSVIAGEQAEKCAELHLRHCTGLQVQVYPAFQGSWPEAAPATIAQLEFKTEGLSVLVNWGLDHHQETLHHLMIAPNQYFPAWVWANQYTAEELDQLIKHLLNSGVRVDAVGFQGHLNVNRAYDWDSVQNIRRFKDLGLEVYLTELDVSMGMGWKTGDPFPADYEKLQAERFYGIVRAAREAGVHRIDVWGLSEAVNHHWLVGQRPRLFDEEFKPRTTYQAVLRALYDTQKDHSATSEGFRRET